MYTLNSGLYTSTASLNLFVMYSIYTSNHINRYSFEIFFFDNQEGRNRNRKNECVSAQMCEDYIYRKSVLLRLFESIESSLFEK